MRGNPWYGVAVGLATGGAVATGDQLRAVARALVLLGLERGSRTAAELPRAWPVTRAAIHAALADAVAARLCEPVGDAMRTFRLTARGRALVEGMRARRPAA
jgi:hypothetical protein